MFRNTWSIVVMLLGPILVIAVLSSAFSEMMKSYEGMEEFTAGYRVQEAEHQVTELMKFAGEESGILFYEYPEGEIKDVMEKNGLTGFVELSKDTYTIYILNFSFTIFKRFLQKRCNLTFFLHLTV